MKIKITALTAVFLWMSLPLGAKADCMADPHGDKVYTVSITKVMDPYFHNEKLSRGCLIQAHVKETNEDVTGVATLERICHAQETKVILYRECCDTGDYPEICAITDAEGRIPAQGLMFKSIDLDPELVAEYKKRLSTSLGCAWTFSDLLKIPHREALKETLLNYIQKREGCIPDAAHALLTADDITWTPDEAYPLALLALPRYHENYEQMPPVVQGFLDNPTVSKDVKRKAATDSLGYRDYTTAKLAIERLSDNEAASILRGIIKSKDPAVINTNELELVSELGPKVKGLDKDIVGILDRSAREVDVTEVVKALCAIRKSTSSDAQPAGKHSIRCNPPQLINPTGTATLESSWQVASSSRQILDYVEPSGTKPLGVYKRGQYTWETCYLYEGYVVRQANRSNGNGILMIYKSPAIKPESVENCLDRNVPEGVDIPFTYSNGRDLVELKGFQYPMLTVKGLNTTGGFDLDKKSSLGSYKLLMGRFLKPLPSTAQKVSSISQSQDGKKHKKRKIVAPPQPQQSEIQAMPKGEVCGELADTCWSYLESGYRLCLPDNWKTFSSAESMLSARAAFVKAGACQ